MNKNKRGKNNGKVLIMLLVITIILIAIVVTIDIFNNKESEEVSNNQIENYQKDEVSYEKYQDLEYGILLEYPKEWTIENSFEEQGYVTIKSNDENSIYIARPSINSILDGEKEFELNKKLPNGEKYYTEVISKDIKINNTINACRIEGYIADNGYQITLLAEKNRYLYKFSFYIKNGKDETQLKIYEYILNNLQIID